MRFRKVEKCEVRFTFIFKDKKRRDIDNYAATVKMVMDGLVQAGILPDDDYKRVTKLEMQIVVDKFEGVKVELMEV